MTEAKHEKFFRWSQPFAQSEAEEGGPNINSIHLKFIISKNDGILNMRMES